MDRKLRRYSMANETDANVAATVTGDPGYRAVLWAECCLALSALLPNCLLLSMVWRSRLFPSNLRLLLANLNVSLLWYSLGCLAKGLYLTTVPLQRLAMSYRNCVVLEMTLVNLPLLGTFLALLGLCVERAYATVRYRKYGKSNVLVAVFLLLAGWTVTFALNTHGLPSVPNNIYRPLCDTYLFVVNNEIVAPYMLSYASLELIATLIAAVVRCYGKHMQARVVVNRAQYDLSARFLVDQNCQINQLILPSVVLHCFFHIPSYMYMSFILPQLPLDIHLGTKGWLLHLSYLWRLLYAVAHPVLAILINPYFRQQFKKGRIGGLLRRITGVDNRIGNAAPKISEESAHFFYLQQMWGQKVLVHPIFHKARNAGFFKK